MIDSFLKELGYSDRFPDYIHRHDGVIYWHKRVPETMHHQVVVKMWPPCRDGSNPSFEIEMSYETRCGIWANSKYYDLTESELKENLSRLEACLKESMLYMNANPMHYRFNGSD